MSYLLFLGMKVANNWLMSVSRHRNDKEFQESTKTVLNAVRPHLRQALENALAVTQMQNQLAAMNQVLEDGQQALISVTENGRIRFITPSAQRLLRQYGLHTQAYSDRLPLHLSDWVSHSQRQLDRSDDVISELQPLLIQGELGYLTIRLIVKASH